MKNKVLTKKVNKRYRYEIVEIHKADAHSHKTNLIGVVGKITEFHPFTRPGGYISCSMDINGELFIFQAIKIKKIGLNRRTK